MRSVSDLCEMCGLYRLYVSETEGTHPSPHPFGPRFEKVTKIQNKNESDKSNPQKVDSGPGKWIKGGRQGKKGK
jgi:hypothetical protein